MKNKHFTLDTHNTLSYDFKFDNKEHLTKMMSYALEKFGEYHKSDIIFFEHGSQGVYGGLINITFIVDINKTIKESIDYFYTYSIKNVTF